MKSALSRWTGCPVFVTTRAVPTSLSGASVRTGATRSRPGIGVRMDGLHLGGGIIAGQNLGFILNELTRDAALVEDFDELAIPFRAVATDLGNRRGMW